MMTEAQTRKPREAGSRTQQMRRPERWSRPEGLPNPDDRPGWKHRWVRVSMMGSADAKNISSSFREGYEPCKAEEYPEMMMHAVEDGRFQGNIEVGGLLLCRIPTEFLGQRAEYYEAQNKANMESVDNSFMKDSHPNMKKFSEKTTKVSFGSGY
ncbi:hypothetical protein EBT31_04015 [bacterium]|jgi:hypothetical protein|nr:hypothetical protein [bacterium]NBX49180.1 hypothetical protein [bacterium]